MKKIFVLFASVAIFFSCQNESQEQSRKNQAKPKEIKLNELKIADSPDSLNEFLIKIGEGIKNHGKTYPFPKKGEFETTDEYGARVEKWKLLCDIDKSKLYKATGLFPVKLREYDADKEAFRGINVIIRNASIEKVRVGFWGIYHKVEGPIDDVLATGYGTYMWNPVYYPREKARNLREDSLRCDIVFNLDCDYTPGPWPYLYNLYIKLYSMKIYSEETGDIVFRAFAKE